MKNYYFVKYKIMEFPKKYRIGEVKRNLEAIAKNEKYLVDKWILKKDKNKYYKNDNNYSDIGKGDTEYYALIDWILPSVYFKYREVTYSEYCKNDKEYKLIRSSIIPIVEIDGEQYWMLGSFHDYKNTEDPILTDFAGSCEKKDMKNGCPPLNCALRELREESKGLLNDIILNSIQNQKNIAIFEGVSKKMEKLYFMFVSLNYDDVKNIPMKFSQTEITYEKLGPISFYKQKDIKKYKYRTAKNLTDFIEYLNL